MKSTGMVRYIDDLGRVVIPKDIRRGLNIKEGDQLEIFTEGESVIFKKYYTSNDIKSLIDDAKRVISGSVNLPIETLDAVIDKLNEAKKLLE